VEINGKQQFRFFDNEKDAAMAVNYMCQKANIPLLNPNQAILSKEKFEAALSQKVSTMIVRNKKRAVDFIKISPRIAIVHRGVLFSRRCFFDHIFGVHALAMRDFYAFCFSTVKSEPKKAQPKFGKNVLSTLQNRGSVQKYK
jgi:hypothetical protein